MLLIWEHGRALTYPGHFKEVEGGPAPPYVLLAAALEAILALLQDAWLGAAAEETLPPAQLWGGGGCTASRWQEDSHAPTQVRDVLLGERQAPDVVPWPTREPGRGRGGGRAGATAALPTVREPAAGRGGAWHRGTGLAQGAAVKGQSVAASRRAGGGAGGGGRLGQASVPVAMATLQGCCTSTVAPALGDGSPDFGAAAGSPW